MTTLDRSALDACSTPCAIAHIPLSADVPAVSASEATLAQASLAASPRILAPLDLPTPSQDESGTGVAPTPAARSSRTAPRPVDEEGEVGWVGPCSPERPVMEILFRCIEAGRRYYAVRLNGQEIFVGTRPECDRFLDIHNEKVALEQAEARRTPRGRPAALHIYRTARA